MVIIFEKENLISERERDEILQALDELCRIITAFSVSLKEKL